MSVFCVEAFLYCIDFSAAVADLKNEHELDRQHLRSLHRQEVEALKTAHSHTRWEQTLSSTQLLGMMSVVYMVEILQTRVV